MIKLHHIGYVVSDISKFKNNLILNQKISEIYDPIQKANLALFSTFSDTLIELIQPENSESFTWKNLQKHGNHYHHLCYEISKEYLNKIVIEKNLIHVSGPHKAILFQNKQVDFYFNRNKEIVEFLIQ